MVIFISQNKITDFVMILAWACPLKVEIAASAANNFINFYFYVVYVYACHYNTYILTYLQYNNPVSFYLKHTHIPSKHTTFV